MERHLYRFRTADRLLGKDAVDGREAVPGELEKLEIYFAPPDQLNDPLEGYKEIYWSGAKIIWLNFFSHYLLILALRSWQVDDIARGTPLPKELPVWMYPSQLDTICLAAYQEMDELLRTDEIFHGYANAFAKSGSKHYKPQLLYYLVGLHSRFLSIVLTVNERRGMTLVKQVEAPFDASFDYQYHLRPIAEIEAHGGSGQDFNAYKQIALNIAAYEIKTAGISAGHPIPIDELVEMFATRYLDQIEVLMHPRWYISCFMKECDNSSIWGSYGDNHKGMCLRYRVSEEEARLTMEMHKPIGLGFKGIEFGFQTMEFQEVFYNREHSEIDFFRSLGNIPNEALGCFWYNDGDGNFSNTSEWYKTDSREIREKHWGDFNLSLTSKTPQWASEKEYRLVLQSGIDLSDKKNRLLKYKFSSLDGVIFGIKTPLEHKLKVARLIRDHCKRENVDAFQFYQAYYDPKTKSIQHGLLPISAHDAD